MSDYLFAPAERPAVAVRGEARRFPIHRIFCVGRNYEAHAREMGATADREAPFYFTKSAHAFVPGGAMIPYAPGTANLHYEMELVVAIGRDGFRIAAEQALAHVYGYACGLDMTRRDLQFALRDKQRPWDLAKDFEQAAVLGEIVPVAVCGHPAGRIVLWLNGQLRQSATLDQMVHGVPALIAHLSRYYHLRAGDLLFTGTPEGVGPVAAGDVLRGEIEGLGEIGLSIGAAE